MRLSKEHMTSIVINLISDILWVLISFFVGTLPVLITKTFNVINISVFCVVFTLFLLLYMKIRKPLYYIKWDFFIKKNTYVLTLHDASVGQFRNGSFKQIYDAYTNVKGARQFSGSYDWKDTEKITDAKVTSRLSEWTLMYRNMNTNQYTRVKSTDGTKKLPNGEKYLEYIIDYSDASCANNEKIENTVAVDFEYNTKDMKPELYAGIKHPVGELNLVLYASDDIVSNVNYYAKTFLGKEYDIIEKIPLSKEVDESGKTYYKKTIKRPKLFCKYIISWDWV